jgi:hypothetical protein
MVDLTQAASVAEFTAAGASPAEAAILVEQHEALAGRRGPDARAALAPRDPAPPGAPPPPASPVTPSAASTALEAHESGRVAQELDKAMLPPSAPGDYRFPSSLDPETDEAWAADAELKSAFHSEGFPRFLVESIGKDLAKAAATRMEETPDQAQARIASTRATLERWYGRETDANLALVDALIDRLRAKGGATREFVEAIAPHLDALSLDALIQFAKHSASKH